MESKVVIKKKIKDRNVWKKTKQWTSSFQGETLRDI